MRHITLYTKLIDHMNIAVMSAQNKISKFQFENRTFFLQISLIKLISAKQNFEYSLGTMVEFVLVKVMYDVLL